MTTQEVIATVSATIATISLVANVIQATVIYRLNRKNVSVDDIVASLRSLLAKLEATSFFTVKYNDEIWEYGFRSLEDLVALSSAAHVQVEHSRYVGNELRDSLAVLHKHLKGIKAFRDGYSTFGHGREGAPYHVQRDWPELAAAEAARSAAGPAVDLCKRQIQRFLSAAA